jgi:hypothetical protein
LYLWCKPLPLTPKKRFKTLCTILAIIEARGKQLQYLPTITWDKQGRHKLIQDLSKASRVIILLVIASTKSHLSPKKNQHFNTKAPTLLITYNMSMSLVQVCVDIVLERMKWLVRYAAYCGHFQIYWQLWTTNRNWILRLAFANNKNCHFEL